MKKFRKNKFVVLAICVAIVSFVYFVAQKAIDEYSFRMNGDIISEDFSDTDGHEDGDDSEWGDGSGQAGEKDSGKVPEEETDLILEEADEGASLAASEDVDGVDEEKEEDSVNNKIYVYITGEVNVPGVIILNDGSRIVDAINAAGGTTSKANVSKVNLVYILEDGMKVNIPNDNDLKNNPDFEYITLSSGDGTSGGSGEGKGSSSETGGGKYTSSAGSYGVVNINTATQTELETLPGIGPSLALSIINYRKENGRFSSIEEIKNVSGIGEAKFEKMKSFIKV